MVTVQSLRRTALPPRVDDRQHPTNFSHVDWGQVADGLGLRLR